MFSIGGNVMNTIVTSKEDILAVCRELAAQEGLQKMNIRTVAEKCGISVGSVYNYFPSKSNLIAATIQEVWQSIFHMDKGCNKEGCFTDYVLWIFNSVQDSATKYPNFFALHSMSFAHLEKGKARQVMDQYFDHMKAGLLHALQNDVNVRASAFSDEFSQKSFVDFVFSSLISMLMKQENMCNVLIEIVKRIIY